MKAVGAVVVPFLRRCRPQPIETSGHFVGEVAEVFAGHPNVEVVNTVGPEVCDRGLFESSGQRDVVVHVGIAMTDFQVGLTSMRLRGAVDEGGDEVVCALSPCFVHGSEGALDGDAVREHVRGAQGFHPPKREHRCHIRRAHPGNGLLGSHNDCGGSEDRVLAQMRQGGVPPLATHGQVNFVC